MKTSLWKSVLTTGLTVTICMVLLTGCGKKTDPAGNTQTDPTKNGNITNNSDVSKEITIKPVTAKEYAEEVAKHKGKVVLVDFWATWCVPCKKAFPHTVQLHDAEKDHGLEVISLSMDLYSEDEPLEVQSKKALTFLKDQKAKFTHLIANPPDPDVAYADFEITNDSLPHFKLYGRDGKLIRAFFDNEDDADQDINKEVDAAVQKALSQK